MLVDQLVAVLAHRGGPPARLLESFVKPADGMVGSHAATGIRDLCRVRAADESGRKGPRQWRGGAR